MACATLKRHLEWDPLQGGPHSLTPRAAKRARRLAGGGPFAARQHAMAAAAAAATVSPFQDAAPKLSTELIAESVCNEVRRLQRRKQLQSSGGLMGSSPPMSPPGSPNGLAGLGPSTSTGVSGTSSASATASCGPLFTFKQVNLICERMLREREEELRQYYDRVLNDKLAEQYDAFVRFTQDQIHRRFADDRSGAPSYCS